MKTKDLLNYSPYTIARQKGEYADIAFENDGLMTVPKTSAPSIIKLLNEAFQNGVKMTMRSISSNQFQNNDYQEIKSKPQPIIELEYINNYSKK